MGSILARVPASNASATKALRGYPGSTEEEIKKAHAYAYGGCLVADMGYMPFGNPYFTDLLHYVRSGDFVSTLIEESQNLDEYAFAIGALSHYMADKYGHSLATNKSVPLANPDLQKKFGDVVTYDDDHTSHSKMELAYDVIQTAKGHYASAAYHDFIGFSMAKPVLERAFLKVYGQDLSQLFPKFESSVATFRWGVRNLFPAMIHNAWKSKKDEILKSDAKVTRGDFRYRMSRKTFNNEFGADYTRPDFKARTVAFVIKILPKVGALKKFKFKYPGVASENLFVKSMDSILFNYNVALKHITNNKIRLSDIDFDTGKHTRANEYPLADKTYDSWLTKLQDDNFACVDRAMKQNILSFYSAADSARVVQRDPDNGAKALTAVKKITSVSVNVASH